jgi:hypothetical protein
MIGIKMKLFFCALLLPGLVAAAILPDTIGAYRRTASAKPEVADRAVWDELGLKNSETDTYQNGPSKFTATAWQLQDTTASLAAFDWQRPAGAKPSNVSSLAVETPDGLMLVHGNYLLSFRGYKPTTPELDAVAASLINVDQTPLPILPGYLPAQGLEPNSERYILGPASLQKFDPAIPPSVAAFHFGTEAQTGVFHTPKGNLTVGIFNYPAPQMAMLQLPEFQKLPGAMAKRSGPLIAVIISPPDADAAERLLGTIRYQAEVTRDEYVPTRRDNIGNLIVNVFILIGFLLLFATVSGFAVGGARVLLRALRKGEDPEAMICLHLERR